jgi:hypothetical protein
MLEEEDSSPIVGKVLGHLAGCARGPLAHVAQHCDVERIAADDVVQMGGWIRTGLNDGVEALEGQGRAWKAEASLSQRHEC